MTAGCSGQEGETIRRRITRAFASTAAKRWTKRRIGSHLHRYAGVLLRLSRASGEAFARP
jgi:hypothetical protein